MTCELSLQTTGKESSLVQMVNNSLKLSGLCVFPLEFQQFFFQTADNLRVVIASVGNRPTFRFVVLSFQQTDALPDSFLIISDRLIPNGRVAAASGCAGTPVDGYRIRPVNGLPDMDRVGSIQFDFFNYR